MQQLVIISGRSGSGKTVALHSLEDLGFYCIDNLPVAFLSLLPQTIGSMHPKIAISIDSRNLQLDLHDINNIKDIIEQKLQIYYKQVAVIYLDAMDNILLQRFSDTRRKHPLTSINKNFTLREAIEKERDLLASIVNLADFILDTSKLSHHELHGLIRSRINKDISSSNQLHLLLQSFGFKYGLPVDADFIFDLRCLPNPYWVPNLRDLTGLDQDVKEFLANNQLVQTMTDKLITFIKDWLSCFKNDRRSYITIALGCTGGKHRSVYLVENIANMLKRSSDLGLANIQVRHKELLKLQLGTTTKYEYN
jgi:UPF0042 nucleotide-binding protein